MSKKTPYTAISDKNSKSAWEEYEYCSNCGRRIPPEHMKWHPNARFCPPKISNCKNRFWSRPYRRLNKIEKEVKGLLKKYKRMNERLDSLVNEYEKILKKEDAKK